MDDEGWSMGRRRSRAELGNCEWHYHDVFRQKRAELEAERHPSFPDDDEPWEYAALEHMDALIEAAESRGGLGENQYDAPVGRDLAVRPLPWLGELKARGVHRRNEGGARQYRLYFAEPQIDRALLAAHLGHKSHREMTASVGGSRRPRSSAAQTKAMRVAAGNTKRWCRDRGIEYRIQQV